jgi:hypothetical protein
LEKNIKDQLKSNAVMSKKFLKVLLEGERIFANSDCFLKRNREEISLLYLKVSRGDGIK